MDMLMFFYTLKMHGIIFVRGCRFAGLFLLLGGLAACQSLFTNRTADESLETTGSIRQVEYGARIYPSRFRSAALTLQRSGGRSMIGKPYQIRGRWYYPMEEPDYSRVGLASWYGSAFHGRLTANGEIFDMNQLTAAHQTMPLPSYARVTNLKNGASLLVRVNDRGPFAHNRIIDLSRRAAQLLGYQNNGLAQVKVEYVGPAPVRGGDERYLMASYDPAGNQNLLYGSDEERERHYSLMAKADAAGPPMQPDLSDPLLLPAYGPRITLKSMLMTALP